MTRLISRGPVSEAALLDLTDAQAAKIAELEGTGLHPMNANDIIEKCAEICDQSAKELDDGRSFYNVAIKILRESAAEIRALKSSLPAETVSDAAVERAAMAMASVIAKRHGDKDAYWMSDARREEARAALEAAALAHADDGWQPIETAPGQPVGARSDSH